MTLSRNTASPAWRPPHAQGTASSWDGLLRPVALGLFFLIILLSVGLVRLMVGGLPVRALLTLALFGLLWLNDPGVLKRIVQQHPRALLIVTAFMLIGTLTSLANQLSVAETARQLLEIHVQALLGLAVGNAMIRLCGLRAVLMIIVGVFLFSILVAFGQFAGLEPAWALRRWLGAVQHDSPLTQVFYLRRDRTMGISFSPIHLATQSCLAFAACFIYANRNTDFLKGLRFETIIALIVVVAACLASGNRSPLLGVIAFTFLYLAVVNRPLFLLALIVAVVFVPAFSIVQEQLQALGLRIASTDDGSAEGRGVLANYGVRLLMDNPLGYGLGFDSTEHWSDYWQYLQYADNSQAVKNYALHNYFLMLLNKYGVSALMVLPLLLPRSRRDWIMLLAFVPYFFHVAFHNDGPLQADFLVWYIIVMGQSIVTTSPDQAAAQSPAWRRYLPNASNQTKAGMTA